MAVADPTCALAYVKFLICVFLHGAPFEKIDEQAGAELGQAQVKWNS